MRTGLRGIQEALQRARYSARIGPQSSSVSVANETYRPHACSVGESTADITLSELIDRWLSHATPSLAAWTLRGYVSKIETHIRPALGRVSIAALTPDRLDAFYRELLVVGGPDLKPEQSHDGRRRTRPRRPLSPQSVKHIHAIIHRALEQGRRWGLIAHNPAGLAQPPHVEPKDIMPPTADEIRAVAQLCGKDMVELVHTAVVTGARRGELCGLRWSDLRVHHLDTGRTCGELTISRSVADTPDGIILKRPKSRKIRRLAIDQATVMMLVKRRARLASEAAAFGTKYRPDGFIFPGDVTGAAPLRPQLVTKRWRNAAARAHVNARFHDLRHFAITELLEGGFDIAEVAARHGHASKVMTLDRYGHSRRARDLGAAQYLANILREDQIDPPCPPRNVSATSPLAPDGNDAIT
jgi:integrase